MQGLNEYNNMQVRADSPAQTAPPIAEEQKRVVRRGGKKRKGIHFIFLRTATTKISRPQQKKIMDQKNQQKHPKIVHLKSIQIAERSCLTNARKNQKKFPGIILIHKFFLKCFFLKKKRQKRTRKNLKKNPKNSIIKETNILRRTHTHTKITYKTTKINKQNEKFLQKIVKNNIKNAQINSH